MEKNLLLLLASFIFIVGCSDNKNRTTLNQDVSDSLHIYIANSQNAKLGNRQRIFNAKRAYLLLDDHKNNAVYRNSLSDLATQFYLLKQDKELKKTLNLSIDKSTQANDSLNIAKAFYLKGNQYINLGLNDSAYIYLLKSEKLFKILNDSLNLGKNYIDKAFVQLYESDYSGCELSSIQGLAYLKPYNILQSEYDAYNLIGISSNELKNYDNALTYHKKALSIASQGKLVSKFHYEASSRNNIGVVYQNLNNHRDAIEIFRFALKEKNLLQESPEMYAMITDNLAYSKFKLKDYQDLPALFFKSLRIREEINMSSGVIANKIHLSEFYADQNDTLSAQKYANEALQLAKTTKISGDLLGSLKQLSVVEHKKASQYSKEYIKISDSLQQEERKAKDKFARIQFETDEILLEKDKLAEQNRSLLYFFIATLFIGLLLFVIRSQRAKNRELLLIQAQQKANEDIYSLMISQQSNIEESRVKEKKRIAQELHDGVLGRLFGARLNLDSLNKFSDEESIISRYNYLNELKNIEQDIREISHDLNREKYVLINNFLAIVNNLLEDQKNSYPSSVSSVIDEEIRWEQVNNNIKINLYRILQESLQNINKYAKAKKINIIIKKLDNKIVLNVSDDGIGFNPNTRKKGIGLENMQARANECNGTLEIKSNNGSGTVIMVELPTES